MTQRKKEELSDLLDRAAALIKAKVTYQQLAALMIGVTPPTLYKWLFAEKRFTPRGQAVYDLMRWVSEREQKLTASQRKDYGRELRNRKQIK